MDFPEISLMWVDQTPKRLLDTFKFTVRLLLSKNKIFSSIFGLSSVMFRHTVDHLSCCSVHFITSYLRKASYATQRLGFSNNKSPIEPFIQEVWRAFIVYEEFDFRNYLFINRIFWSFSLKIDWVHLRILYWWLFKF